MPFASITTAETLVRRLLDDNLATARFSNTEIDAALNERATELAMLPLARELLFPWCITDAAVALLATGAIDLNTIGAAINGDPPVLRILRAVIYNMEFWEVTAPESRIHPGAPGVMERGIYAAPDGKWYVVPKGDYHTISAITVDYIPMMNVAHVIRTHAALHDALIWGAAARLLLADRQPDIATTLQEAANAKIPGAE